MIAASPAELLDSRFLQQLDHLRIARGGAFTECEMGDATSRRHGVSVEFADYRDYQPGDDYRTIDWTLLGRLDRLFVRLFRAEENLRLELHIDTSSSMHFGRPSKVEYAVRLAAALGYIALRNGDRVSVSMFGAEPHARFGNTRGRSAITELFRFLTQADDSGGTDIDNSLRRFSRANPGSGIAVVMSDLMDPAGFERGLDTLIAGNRQPVVIHLLSPEEIMPDATGDFTWVDAETRSTVEITVDGETLALYRETLNAWVGEIQSFCNSRRIPYYQVDTGSSLQDLVLRSLRKGGLLA